MKRFLHWLWMKYAKNTFVRHIVISLVAFIIAVSVTPLQDALTKIPFISTNNQAVGILTALAAWLLRWAQTRLELEIASLKH